MNTAHILAWLTCLALAFFACILGVRNAGSVIARKQEVARLREQMEKDDGMSESHMAGELGSIQDSLAQIAEELKALRETRAGEAAPGLAEKMEKLESQIRDLQEAMRSSRP
jgi:chemotaxis protein histidine kinase CheA